MSLHNSLPHPKLFFSRFYHFCIWNGNEVVHRSSGIFWMLFINEYLVEVFFGTKNLSLWTKSLKNIHDIPPKKFWIGLYSSCCDCCFHWELWSHLNTPVFQSCVVITIVNIPHYSLYTPMLIRLRQISTDFYVEIKSWKMMQTFENNCIKTE